jgi:hypothetical protein
MAPRGLPARLDRCEAVRGAVIGVREVLAIGCNQGLARRQAPRVAASVRMLAVLSSRLDTYYGQGRLQCRGSGSS